MIHLVRNQVGVTPIYDKKVYGSIIIPETSGDRCDQGIVKYLGRDCSSDISIGDYILFSGYTGTHLMVDSEEVIILTEDFITAKILGYEDTKIEGIFLRDDDVYYTPTYEALMTLIASQMENISGRPRIGTRPGDAKHGHREKTDFHGSK